MNLPAAIAGLVQAQNNLDHEAYAACFNEAAIVHDEGHTHKGTAEIREWIKAANAKYNSSMEVLNLTQTRFNAVLEAKVSGTFAGSPLVLKYHMVLKDGLIHSLKVTG